MKLSIGRVMIGVALLAAAFSVVSSDVRYWYVHNASHDQVVGVLPMATVLIYGLCGAGMDLAAGRSTGRYLVGFQAGGWAAILFYLSWCAATFEWENRPMGWIADATSRVLSHEFAFDDPTVMAAHMACFLVPEFIVATVGGWIGSRLGIVMMRQERAAAEMSSVAQAGDLHEG